MSTHEFLHRLIKQLNKTTLCWTNTGKAHIFYLSYTVGLLLQGILNIIDLQ